MESNEGARVPSSEDHARRPPAGLPETRSGVTDFVSAAWAGLACYLFCDAAHARHPGLLTWTGILATFFAACACLQRWRWGRWAVLGMAGCILADATAGAVRCAGPDGLLTQGLTGFLRWSEDVLEAYGCGEPVGACIIALAAFTLVWLCRSATHREFEWHKRERTRRWQFCVAGAFLAVFLLGLSGSGIAGRVRARAIAVGAGIPDVALARVGMRVVSRIGSARPASLSTSGPAGRR